MSLLLLAYWELLVLESPLRRKDFAAIYQRVRRTPVRARSGKPPGATQLCRAVDLAAVLYFRKVLCLQRSAAAVCLLKRYGFPGQLVVGVQQRPFALHAWVELDGAVVNDRPYMPEIYAVLERCR
jgi:hypothetical protein